MLAVFILLDGVDIIMADPVLAAIAGVIAGEDHLVFAITCEAGADEVVILGSGRMQVEDKDQIASAEGKCMMVIIDIEAFCRAAFKQLIISHQVDHVFVKLIEPHVFQEWI